MAIVDSLLRLVTVRGADALIMRAGEVPFLERGETASKLSMPVPGDDIVQAILADVTRTGGRDSLDATGTLATTYQCDETAFIVQIERSDHGYHFAFRLGAAGIDASPRAPEPPPPPDLQPPSARDHLPESTVPYRDKGGELGIEEVLERAAKHDASDIIISCDKPPRLRIGGAMKGLGSAETSHEQLEAFLAPVLGERQRAELDESGSCDVAMGVAGRRYRVNVFKQLGGVAAAFRPINRAVPTLDKLHLPDDFKRLTRFRSGLVLMVGTAGSGKSTTLVALIEHLNRTQPKHIITLEDPIEYTYRPREALIHQREVGQHVSSFATGLRASLRESPDVILVGEMRDHDTIRAALTAAETGHLVLSTLHSGSADMAIHRIVDVFPEHQQEQVRHQLADVLRAVVTQHLVPSSKPPLRVPAFERLMVTQAVATKIRENRCHQIGTELQRGREEGMVTLELSLARLVKKGLVTMRAAHDLAEHPTLLEQLVRT
jgi:twitching motility protein PilT